jgi:hypothetical protein
MEYSEQDLADFAKMLGINLDEPIKPKKPNPNQKAINEIDKMLKRYRWKQ